MTVAFSGDLGQVAAPDKFEAGQNRGFDRGFIGSGDAGTTFFFKMRAEKDPGPGYEVWIATETPDFAGSGAGGPIITGTAVVVSEWSV